MEKVQLVVRIEEIKKNLPRNRIPIFQCKYPEYDNKDGEYKLRRFFDAYIHDQNIMEKLEALEAFFNDKVN